MPVGWCRRYLPPDFLFIWIRGIRSLPKNIPAGFWARMLVEAAFAEIRLGPACPLRGTSLHGPFQSDKASHQEGKKGPHGPIEIPF